VWEADLKKLKIDTVVEKIKDFATKKSEKFGSTRELDYQIFSSLS
jgi:hypothetical protein